MRSENAPLEVRLLQIGAHIDDHQEQVENDGGTRIQSVGFKGG